MTRWVIVRQPDSTFLKLFNSIGLRHCGLYLLQMGSPVRPRFPLRILHIPLVVLAAARRFTLNSGPHCHWADPHIDQSART